MNSVRLRLYKSENYLNRINPTVHTILKPYDLSIHKLHLFQLSKFGYGFFVNLFWYIFTFGSCEVLIVENNDKLVHFTYIIPKVFRFPFMKKGDIQIGPCLTTENYRKKGIYGAVLHYIIAKYSGNERILWIYTAEKNIASQSVIEKVGFQFFSFASISRFLRIIKTTT